MTMTSKYQTVIVQNNFKTRPAFCPFLQIIRVTDDVSRHLVTPRNCIFHFVHLLCKLSLTFFHVI